jgi:hypothetical protein
MSLEELSGANERRMIIPMMTTGRLQQRDDHRLRGLELPILALIPGLGNVVFWNARDLGRKLAEFQVYDNAARRHASLEGHTSLAFASGHTAVPANLNYGRWVCHCRDLVQLPVAA